MADDRLEREINEILDNIDRFPGPESRRKRARRRLVRRLINSVADGQRAVARQLSRIAIGQVMLASFLMVLASFFFRRFNPVAMQWVLLAGIVLFVSSFAILVFTRGTPGWAGERLLARTRDRRPLALARRAAPALVRQPPPRPPLAVRR